MLGFQIKLERLELLVSRRRSLTFMGWRVLPVVRPSMYSRLELYIRHSPPRLPPFLVSFTIGKCSITKQHSVHGPPAHGLGLREKGFFPHEKLPFLGGSRLILGMTLETVKGERNKVGGS